MSDLQGTNAKEAKELIDNSGMEIISATEFQEAADKVARSFRSFIELIFSYIFKIASQFVRLSVF